MESYFFSKAAPFCQYTVDLVDEMSVEGRLVWDFPSEPLTCYWSLIQNRK